MLTINFLLLIIIGVVRSESNDTCDGSGISELANPLWFFNVNKDCRLQISKEPITRQLLDFPSIDNTSFCATRKYHIFPWNKEKTYLGVMGKLEKGTGYMLHIFDLDVVGSNGTEVDLQYADATNEERIVVEPSEIVDTCHRNWQTEQIVCYRFLNTTTYELEEIVLQEVPGNDTNFGYVVQSVTTVEFPKSLHVDRRKILSYDTKDGSHLWMRTQLNWLYNLDVEERWHKGYRAPLTLHHSYNHFPNLPYDARLIYGDENGVVIAQCRKDITLCRISYNYLTEVSGLKHSCMMEFEYGPDVYMGVIVEPFLIEEAIVTTTAAAQAPEAAALVQDQNTGTVDKEEVYHDPYAPLMVLALMVFAYLIIVIFFSFYPKESQSLAQLLTYLELEIAHLPPLLKKAANEDPLHSTQPPLEAYQKPVPLRRALEPLPSHWFHKRPEKKNNSKKRLNKNGINEIKPIEGSLKVEKTQNTNTYQNEKQSPNKTEYSMDDLEDFEAGSKNKEKAEMEDSVQPMPDPTDAVLLNRDKDGAQRNVVNPVKLQESSNKMKNNRKPIIIPSEVNIAQSSDSDTDDEEAKQKK